MLWYKAWLETRSRFCIALVLCVAFCSELLVALPRNMAGKVDLMGLHGVNSALVFIWIFGVTLLMMGGLLRERANGSSSFTLSLPVSRLHLVTVRMVMGVMQSVVLAIVPWIAMLIVAGAAGKSEYLSQAGFHVFLLLAGGVVFLAFALLLSAVIEGEYTAPIVSLGAIILVAYTMSGKDLIPYSPVSFMTGLRYYSFRTSLLTGPLPWFPAVAFVASAVCLFIISVKVIQRRDF
jgi:ABC-type transport system involved in multi-copper enzyme maturation permease subunit